MDSDDSRGHNETGARAIFSADWLIEMEGLSDPSRICCQLPREGLQGYTMAV